MGDQVQRKRLEADLLLRARTLATFKLVLLVAQSGDAATDAMGIRELGRRIGASVNVATDAVHEAVTKGWLERVAVKNSFAYNVAPEFLKTSQKMRREADNIVSESETFSGENVSESETLSAPIVSENETISRKLRRPRHNVSESETFASRAAHDEPHARAGIQHPSSSLRSEEENPKEQEITTTTTCMPAIAGASRQSPEKTPNSTSARKRKPSERVDPTKLAENVFRLYCRIVLLRWRLDSVPSKFEQQAVEVARWLAESRAATEDAFTTWERWWWHDPDSLGFRERTRPWPANVRNTWDSAFMPKPEPKETPNGNRRMDAAERELDRIKRNRALLA